MKNKVEDIIKKHIVGDHVNINLMANELLNLFSVTNRTCSFCGGTEFETTESQYNDVDNDYDRCEITYCTKCRNTHSIDI